MAWIWTLFGLNLDTQKVSGDVKHCIKKLSTRSTYLDHRGYQIQWFWMTFGGNTYFFNLSWGWRRVENRKKSKIHPGGLILGLSTIYYWWIWWIWSQKWWFWWFLKKKNYLSVQKKNAFCAKKGGEKTDVLASDTTKNLWTPPKKIFWFIFVRTVKKRISTRRRGFWFV